MEAVDPAVAVQLVLLVGTNVTQTPYPLSRFRYQRLFEPPPPPVPASNASTANLYADVPLPPASSSGVKDAAAVAWPPPSAGLDVLVALDDDGSVSLALNGQVAVASFSLSSNDPYAQLSGLSAALLPDLAHLVVLQSCATAAGAALQAVVYRTAALVRQRPALQQYAETSAQVRCSVSCFAVSAF